MPPKKQKAKLFVDIPYSELDAKLFADLVTSEQRFRRLAELTNDVIIQSDTSGKIVYATPSVEKMMGYKPEALMYQPFLDFVHISDRARAENDFKQMLLDGEPKRTSGRFIKRDGSIMWADMVMQLATDDKGNVTGTFGTIRDVSVTQQVMQQLHKTNRQLKTFRLAIESAFNHVVVTDPEGKILYANAGATRITGYEIDEMVGQTPALWGKQMPPEFYKDFWHTIKEEKKAFHGEMINKRKTGQLYRAIATVSPILEDDEIIGFIGIEEDISAYKPPEAD